MLACWLAVSRSEHARALFCAPLLSSPNFSSSSSPYSRSLSQDTWYPAHRNCSCCKGYVNACTAPMCLDLGVCGCTLEDSDIHAAAE